MRGEKQKEEAWQAQFQQNRKRRKVMRKFEMWLRAKKKKTFVLQLNLCNPVLEESNTYLLLHQKNLLILCMDLFVVNQLQIRAEMTPLKWPDYMVLRAAIVTKVIRECYLSNRRLCNKIFKRIFRSDCCQAFMQKADFLLIIPSRWAKEDTLLVPVTAENIIITQNFYLF